MGWSLAVVGTVIPAVPTTTAPAAIVAGCIIRTMAGELYVRSTVLEKEGVIGSVIASAAVTTAVAATIVAGRIVSPTARFLQHRAHVRGLEVG